LVSGSEQVSFNGITDKPSLVSSSAQIVEYGIFATTGSNQFNGSQAITGSLTVTGQVVAQTLNVQQVTSSIVYSSGSNVFGNSLGNTQQFTGSLQVSGSSHYMLGNVGISTITPQTPLQILRDTTGNGTSIEESNMAFTVLSAAGQSKISIGASNAGNYGYVQVMQDATSWTNRNLVLQPRGGNVGIGTYSPLSFANTLTVHMNGGSNGSFFTMAGSGTRYLTILAQSGEGKIETNTAIPLILATNEVERMRITSGGNIGIGTTSPVGVESNDLVLQINGNSTAAMRSMLRFTNGNSGTTWGNGVFMTLDSSLDFYFYNLENAATIFGTNGTERMRITSAGNVGIGTDSPTGMLQVGSVGTNSDGQIVLAKKDGSPNRKFRMGLDANFNLSIGDFGNGSSDVYVPQITLNYSNGNVGIGTASPNARLESQVGSPTLTAGLFYNYVGDQTATTLILRSARPDIMYQMQIFNNTSTECFRIEANGNVKNTNSSYGSLSDIKIKENIIDATPKLNDLLKVRIRNYNIIGQEVKQIGVIAQELEEIFPSMVDENQDRDNDGNLLETTTKGVKYSVFVPILIKSIQEQQTQIESLKSENDTLKSILQRNNIS
jgi:hypothetical protein